MKDFLFFNYSWVPNSTFLFKSIEASGFSCDFVDETNIHSFVPKDKYRCVILYLHESWTIPLSNHIINTYCQDSVLIQHDDTDFEDVQVWSTRRPDLVMQREYTSQTRNTWGCPVYPFHFPIHSQFNPAVTERPIDVCFLGSMSNSRRLPFVQHVASLAENQLKHLIWHVNIHGGPAVNKTTQNYKDVISRSKIGLHYFGNSYDSWRIWELASAKTAIIMPWMRNKSVQKGFMPFEDYCIIRDDFSDLEEKILFMLKDERYKQVAQSAFDDYNRNHTPEKCFEYYLDIIKRFVKI